VETGSTPSAMTRAWGWRPGAPFLGVAAASALLLWRLAPDVRAKPIYEDEALAGLVSAHNLTEVLATVHDRGGAPLHFVLASLALALEPSASALRWLSVVLAVAAIPLCYDLARRVASPTAGVAAAAVAASSQMLGVYGSFGRMYALLVLVSALAVDLFVRALHARTRGTALAAATAAVLLPATHPFGIVLLAAEALVGLCVWRGRGLRVAVPVLLVGLALVPLAIADLRLANRFAVGVNAQESVVSPRRAAAVTVRALGGFGGGRGLVFVLFVALALVGGVVLWRRGERGFIGLVVVAAVGLPLILLISRSGQGFSDHFTSRHLIFLLPLWAALVGAGFERVTRSAPLLARAGLLVVLTVAALVAPSVVPDPRSLRSGLPESLAVPAGWLRGEIEPNAVLFPSSPVYLAALPAARHAHALPREQPLLVTRALRQAHFPAPALYVAVPLDGDARVRVTALRSALGPGFSVRRFPSWLLIRAAGPFDDDRAVLERLVRGVSAARASIDNPSIQLEGYMRQSLGSLCGSLRSAGGTCE